MGENVCVEVTQRLRDPDRTEYTSDGIRRHLLYVHCNTPWIRTFQLLIVTDSSVGESDVWREVPTRKKCTVTQEQRDIVIPLLVSQKFEHKIVALSSLSLPITSQEKLRILHDSTYQLKPEINRLEFHFECTGAYVTPLSNYELFDEELEPLNCTIRIFTIPPPTIQRAIAKSLPACAIRRIGIELVHYRDDWEWDEEKIGLRARLLTCCALVCKGWRESGVYDLLWPCLSDKIGSLHLDDNHFKNFVQCVERNPYIAESISSLPCPKFNRYQDGELQLLYGVLMKAAVKFRDLQLSTPQWGLIRSHLPSLQYIERMSLMLRGRDGSKRDFIGKHVRLYDVLGAINRWTRLKELRVQISEVTPNTQVPDTSPAYELRKLTLHGGTYQRPSRYHYLSLKIFEHILSRPASLQTFDANNVTGLSQADFKTIFSLIKSTVVSLSVENCVLDSDSPPDETEERAFDAVVGHMPCLKNVNITTKGQSLASSLGVLRRKMFDDGLSGTFKFNWKSSPNDSMENLENALRITGWKDVTLLIDRDGLDRYDDFATAEKIANTRGVSCSIFLA